MRSRRRDKIQDQCGILQLLDISHPVSLDDMYNATWSAQLETAIAHYRQIYHHWQFSPEQQQTLQRYYTANQLLLDCLQSNCAVTAAIRQDIEATLLLPQNELDAREWQ